MTSPSVDMKNVPEVVIFPKNIVSRCLSIWYRHLYWLLDYIGVGIRVHPPFQRNPISASYQKPQKVIFGKGTFAQMGLSQGGFMNGSFGKGLSFWKGRFWRETFGFQGNIMSKNCISPIPAERE